MGPRPLVTPGQAVDPALDGSAQQPVPGRIELDLVDAAPEAVVGDQPRLIALRTPAVLDEPSASRPRRRLPAPDLTAPFAALALEGLAGAPDRMARRSIGWSGGGWLRTSGRGRGKRLEKIAYGHGSSAGSE